MDVLKSEFVGSTHYGIGLMSVKCVHLRNTVFFIFLELFPFNLCSDLCSVTERIVRFHCNSRIFVMKRQTQSSTMSRQVARVKLLSTLMTGSNLFIDERHSDHYIASTDPVFSV